MKAHHINELNACKVDDFVLKLRLPSSGARFITLFIYCDQFSKDDALGAARTTIMDSSGLPRLHG